MTIFSVSDRAFLDELRRGDPSLAERLSQPLSAFVRASIDESISG